MMYKFLLALGLCLCLGQLGEGTVDIRELRQYLARYEYLQWLDDNNVMAHARVALNEVYESHNFNIIKFYRRAREIMEPVSENRIGWVKATYLQLSDCIQSQNVRLECLKIVEHDQCNIKNFDSSKEEFYAKIEKIEETFGFEVVQGLKQDMETLKSIVRDEMNFEIEINSVESFKAFFKNTHILLVFDQVIEFVEDSIELGVPMRLRHAN